MSFFPPVSSYDFHIYYHHRDQPSRKEAIVLKNSIVSTFKEELDNDKIILKVLRNEQIRGPHITSFYEVDIEDPLVFVNFLSWIQLNHGSLSVLIHPNSEDTYRDHTINAAWLGDKLPLLDYMLKGIDYDPNFGFPSRDLIYGGFYEDPAQYSKSIMIRLLEQGPENDFYNKEAS
jgi:DOPA 4,5-dioxygenase